MLSLQSLLQGVMKHCCLLTITASQQIGHQKTQEESDIVQANAIVHPATVVIKFGYTPASYTWEKFVVIAHTNNADKAGAPSRPQSCVVQLESVKVVTEWYLLQTLQCFDLAGRVM